MRCDRNSIKLYNEEICCWTFSISILEFFMFCVGMLRSVILCSRFLSLPFKATQHAIQFSGHGNICSVSLLTFRTFLAIKKLCVMFFCFQKVSLNYFAFCLVKETWFWIEDYLKPHKSEKSFNIMLIMQIMKTL